MDKCKLSISMTAIILNKDSFKEIVYVALTDYLEKLKKHELGNLQHEESYASNGVNIITDAEYEGA